MKNLFLVIASVAMTLAFLEGLARTPIGDLLADSPIIYFEPSIPTAEPALDHGLSVEAAQILSEKIKKAHANLELKDYSEADRSRVKYELEPGAVDYIHGIGLPRAGYAGSAKATIDGKKIYDVRYTIDAKSTRRAGTRVGKKSRDVIFVGDSFTFGAGVEDFETLPWYFQNFNPEVRVLNLGIPGQSPSEILFEMQNLRMVRYEKIEPKAPTFIFTLIDDELERFRCRLGSLREQWRAEKPWYSYDQQGNVTLRGKCKDRWNALGWIATHSVFFRKAGLNYPFRPQAQEIELFADLILEIRREARKHWPKAEIATVIHPALPTSSFDGLVGSLRSRKLIVLDLRNNIYFSQLGPAASIPLDGHPSAVAHEFLAHLISFHYKKAHPP